MALKTNFTDANFIASPFVDEVANPGDAPGMDRARQGLKDIHVEMEIQRRANELENPTPKPKKPPAKPKGFSGPGHVNRVKFIQDILDNKD